jgi:DNA-binding GntR family transcriptional regulator
MSDLREERDVSPTRTTKLKSAPSLADQAYLVIRRAVAEGELSAGERVTERGLAQELGVSPTPVREAIRRLEQERLLERIDGRTLTVAQPSVNRLYELNLVEAALAGVAARLAANKAQDRELAAIARVHTEAIAASNNARNIDDGIAALRLARRTHQLIYEASHNDQLVDMIAAASAFDWPIRIESIRRLETVYPIGTGVGEHGDVIQALRERDGEKAETLMRGHITAAARRHLDVVAENEFLGID